MSLSYFCCTFVLFSIKFYFEKKNHLISFTIISIYTARLAAFFTLSRVQSPIDSFDDLIKQHSIEYAPLNNSDEMEYFKRMATIEETFYKTWRLITANDSLSLSDRSKLSVFEYPLSNKYIKIWKTIQDVGMPENLTTAIERIRSCRFALLGESSVIKYEAMVECDLKQIGEDFSKKPYAIAVQQGSPLKGAFDNV